MKSTRSKSKVNPPNGKVNPPTPHLGGYTRNTGSKSPRWGIQGVDYKMEHVGVKT